MNKTKSANGKYWNHIDYNENLANEIRRQLNISDFMAKLLSSRVNSCEAAAEFLDPKIKSIMPDPFHLKDMKEGVQRTIEAIKKHEKICIFADYDVDGATSSALLKNVFADIGIDAVIYVPDRMAEGYGPNSGAMQKIKDMGCSLVITVDCGSVAFEALECANNIGMDVIVIDHHISLENLPKAVAVINPNRLDELSDCKNLAAAGVSFLFAVALCSQLRKENFFSNKNIQEPNLINYLDIVALGTVCDVMILTGLNRAYVTSGLKIAKKRKNIGYRTLCDVAGIEEAINCYHLGFILGPRINAGGRVGKSSLGASLLSTKSEAEALKIAQELDTHNEERKAIELTMLEEAKEMALKQTDNSMLFIAGEGWHPGVIGIIAGRLKEQYNKPVAVIALNDGTGKASCRSVRGVDFGNIVIEAKQQELLIAGGGHAMAAGFSVEESKLELLRDFLESAFRSKLAVSDAHMHERFDAELAPNSATLELIKDIEHLEPFGNGNPSPVFKFPNLYVLKADIVGSKHLRVTFAGSKNNNNGNINSGIINAIAFNVVGTRLHEIIMSKKSHNLSAIGKLKINEWQGRQNVQLMLEDVVVE